MDGKLFYLDFVKMQKVGTSSLSFGSREGDAANKGIITFKPDAFGRFDIGYIVALAEAATSMLDKGVNLIVRSLVGVNELIFERNDVGNVDCIIDFQKFHIGPAKEPTKPACSKPACSLIGKTAQAHEKIGRRALKKPLLGNYVAVSFLCDGIFHPFNRLLRSAF